MQIKGNSLKTILKKIMKATIIMLYLVLLVGLIIGGIVAGIMTLIPDDASKACYLGYYAHCSFTPYSTLILFAIGIIGILPLIKLIKHLKKELKNLQENKSILHALVKRQNK